MLNVRLQRIGKRGQAYFRVIIAEHTKKPKGKVLELLGNYDPHQKKFVVQKDRIEYWISKGAQVTPTVNNLMVNYKVWDKPKKESWKPKKKPSDAKTVESKGAVATPVTPATEAPAPETHAETPASETASVV